MTAGVQEQAKSRPSLAAGRNPPGGGSGGRPPTRRPLARRLFRWFGYAVLTLVLVVIAALIAAAVWLHTSQGERFFRTRLLDAANQAIAGRIEVDHVALSGLIDIDLRGVRIYAPGDDVPAIAVNHLVAHIRVTELIGRWVDIPTLILDGPTVRLLHEGDTINLARVFAPKHPSTFIGPPQPSKPFHLPYFHVRLPRLQLHDGSFQMDGARPIALDGLHLDGQLSGSLHNLTASVALGTHLREPVDRNATLDVRAHWNGHEIQVELLSLHADETQAVLSGALALDWSSASVNISQLQATARDVNAFVPAARLRSTIQITGAASFKNRDGKANLEIGAGKGRVRIAAHGNIDKAWQLDLGLTDVDLRAVRAGLPSTLLKLNLHASGRGIPTTRAATADIDMEGSGSRYGGMAVERLDLSAHAIGRTAHIARLHAHTADTDVQIGGTAGFTSADLQVEANAASVDKLRAQLNDGFGIRLPAMSGAAHVTGHFAGRYTNPNIAAVVDAPEFRYASTSLKGLHARVNLDGFKPIPLGSFAVAASRLHALDRDGASLSLVGEIDGRTAAVDAHGLFGENPVELILRGTRQPREHGVESWELSHLEAQFLGLSAVAQRSFDVHWGHGRIQVQHLDMAGFFGTIALDASLSHAGPIDAHLHVANLHLEQLPDFIVPKSLHLAGHARLSLDVRGTERNPDAALSLHVSSAGYRQLVDAGLGLQARLAQHRLTTSLDAHFSNTGQLTLTASIPYVTSLRALLRRNADSPIDVQLTSDHVPLAVLPETLPPLPAMSGTVEGVLSLHGSPSEPNLRMHWTLGHVATARFKELLADLSVAYDGRAVQTHVALNDPMGLDTEITANGEVPVAELLRGRLAWRAWPVNLELALRRLDLGWLQNAGYGPADQSGLVVGRLTSSGMLGSPTVNATFMGTNLAGAGYQHVSLVTDLASAQDIRLSASAQMNGQPLLNLSARADVSPDRLGDMTMAERLAIPFEIKAQLSPTALETLLPGAAASPGETDLPFQATLGAQLYATGTPNVPEMHLHLDLNEQRRNGSETGVITTDLDYRNAKTALAMLFQSPSAGSLKANAVFDANLGVTALRHHLAEALGRRIKLSVDAHRFDLALVNGFSSTIHNLGGKADLHLYKDGPLGAVFSGLSGSLDLSDASLVVLGAGSFSNVTVKAAGAWPSIQVSELSGKSGKGSFSGNLGLERTGPEHFKGNVSLNLKDFPIVVDFQTRGFLSMNVRASGTGEPGRIVIPEIVLSHGHVTIPGQLPKHVQSLDPNPDFEFAQEKPAPKQPVPTGKPWVIVVDKITIPDDLVVDAPLGTKLTLGAHLRLEKSPAVEKKDNPIALSGEIEIIHGVLSLLKPFDVDKGVVTFYPDQLENPRVDVKAHYDGPDVTVYVTLTGNIDDLHKQFTSDPPMDENQILYYLATGEQQTQPQQADPASLQTQMADAALSALGAAAIGVVKGAVEQVLPSIINPDVLTVETDVAHSGIGRVRAGKYYLKGKLYVGGNYNPSANPLLNQNTYEGEARYRITRDNSIRLLIGNEGHHQLEYLYELNFPTAAQKKNAAAAH